MDDLLKCPFCGYEAVLEPVRARKGYEAIVHCNGCLASIHIITHDTEEESTQDAIESWNKRV